MNTPTDLAHFIQAHGIAATLVRPAHETPTVHLAAQAMGCAEEQIIKSVLFTLRTPDAQGETKDDASLHVALVITSGAAQIDYRRLAEVFGVSRKRIKLAPPEVVLAVTGYPVGGVPPFGYPEPIATYVDRSVLERESVFGGGGDEHTLLRITPQELLRVTGAHLIDAK